MSASRFDEAFGAMATAALMQEFGGALNYYAADALTTPISMTGSVGAEEVQERLDANGDRIVEHVRSITISRDPASQWGGRAEPGVNDQVAIGGVLYEVRSAPHKGGNLARLECVRLGTAEKGRPDYRGR